MNVPFVDLSRQFQNLRTEILSAIEDVSSGGSFVMGRNLESFEERFAKYCETGFSLGVGNGTDAIFLGLKALGIGEGDEVITAPNSFIASAGAIAASGAKVVFADVGEDMNLDPEQVERVITKKTKAVLLVHLTGKMADMDAFISLAQKHNIHLLEDAAQAVGATWNGKKAGSFGTFAAFSLHPLKVLHVMGDGGVITTPDESIYKKLILLRNHGLRDRDHCEMWAYNSRLDEIQAAIALIKMKYLDKWIEKNRYYAGIYTKELSGYVHVPTEVPGSRQVFHRYVIRAENRDHLQASLLAKGIETKVNYPIPLHLHKSAAALGYSSGSFPVAEKLSGQILSLPLYAEMSEDELQYTIEAIKEFYS